MQALMEQARQKGLDIVTVYILVLLYSVHVHSHWKTDLINDLLKGI